MAETSPRAVQSFSLRRTTLAKLREVAVEARIVGGMSAIVEDATSSWLKRYADNPEKWLSKRGVPAVSDPVDDL